MMDLKSRLLKEAGALEIQDTRGYGKYHLGYSFTEESINAYTELVVQQCISAIAMIGVSNYENEDISWTVTTAINQIKDKFALNRPVEGSN